MEENLRHFSGRIDTAEKNGDIYFPHPPNKKKTKIEFPGCSGAAERQL